MIFSGPVIKKYKQILFSRQDSRGDVYYFSHEDFPALEFQPYEFKSSEGATLRGGFYSYEGYRKDKLVVFVHGMGGGHRSYMREIEKIARAGFRVFAFDQTGCMESGGDGALGFAHSLSDLDSALSSLKTTEALSEVEISVVGHSWGGFAAMNIPRYHKDIRNIVAISGFISVDAILKDNFKGPLSLFKKDLWRLELKVSKDYAGADARESLSNTESVVLIIHSKDDPVVSPKNNFDSLRLQLAEKDNITFLELDGKRHNPNYTKDALDYKDKFFKELSAHRRTSHTDAENEAFIRRFDWKRMTEQDEEVFKKIIEALNK